MIVGGAEPVNRLTCGHLSITPPRTNRFQFGIRQRVLQANSDGRSPMTKTKTKTKTQMKTKTIMKKSNNVGTQTLTQKMTAYDSEKTDTHSLCYMLDQPVGLHDASGCKNAIVVPVGWQLVRY